MDIRKFKIVVGSLTNNGVVCSNPTIELVDVGCFNLSCIDEANGIYEVTVEEDCQDTCLDFRVICEECHNCPPTIITKCLCDDIDDCGDCQDCIGNVCVDLCEPGEVCNNNVCVECIDNSNCPGNQICLDGECQCPPGTTPEGGRCLECTDGEIMNCLVCVDGVFVPRICGDGECDPETGECVDCINEDQCRPDQTCIDNECQCPPGFVEVDGVCEPEPECVSADDCDACEVCSAGSCIPQICPPGQVCLGEYGCVQECDCDDVSGCSDVTSFCFKDVSTGLCGCIPCEGDCTDGCVSPCFCNEQTNQCENNPCSGPCNDGTDCGDGCGCVNGECIPCSSLSCLNNDCANSLGCECNAGVCVDSDDQCNLAPCATQADCGEGCTCLDGECVSCANFSCTDCANQDGCVCIAGECQNEEEPPCSDIITIEKDDDACSITGTVSAADCCACSPLFFNSLVSIQSLTTTDANYTFQVDLRKGLYNGVSYTSNPLINDFSNITVTENDPPTGGTVRMTAIVNREIFISGVSQGIAADIPLIFDQTYTLPGVDASLVYSGIVLPLIGFSDTVGGFDRVVTSIDVNFSVVSNLQFPNNCTYAVNTISNYNITDQGIYGTNLSDPKVQTLQSSDCRPPVITWYKSTDGTFTDPSFRRIYGEENLGVYVDTLTTLAEGAESCNFYRLESDCNCQNGEEKYVTFCNPEDLDYTLSDCGKTLTINSFSTCDPNSIKTFYVRGGDLNLMFTSATVGAIIGVPQTSTVQIETIEFGLECDSLDECKKTYDTGLVELVPSFSVTCVGSDIDIIFDLNSNVDGCFLNDVTIDGNVVTGGGSITLPAGSYSAVATWTCGCDATMFTVEDFCCDTGFGDISRDCNSTNCTTTTGTTYSVDGTVITDICSYVTALGNGDSAIIRATRDTCGEEFFALDPLTTVCCENSLVTINEVTTGEIDITLSGFNTVTGVTISPTGPVVTQITSTTYNITGLAADTSYQILISDSICGTVPQAYSYDTCLDAVTLQNNNINSPDCQLVADSNQSSCACLTGTFTTAINSVVNNKTNYEVTFVSGVSGFDNSPVDYTLLADSEEVPTGLGVPHTFILEKPVQISENCLTGKLVTSVAEKDGKYGANIAVFIGPDNLITSGLYTDITAEVDGVSVQVGTNAIIVPEDYTFGQTLVITITATEVATGTVYYLTGTLVIKDGTLTYSFCEVVVDESPISTSVVLTGLELEDGCTYFVVTQSFTVSSTGVVEGTLFTDTLTPIVANGRKIKYEWDRDAVQVFEEFSYTDSTLPYGSNYYTNGSDYLVTATCNCETTDSLAYCCEPDVLPELSNQFILVLNGSGTVGNTIIDPANARHTKEYIVQYSNIPTAVTAVVTAHDGTSVTISIPAGSGTTTPFTIPDVVTLDGTDMTTTLQVDGSDATYTHTYGISVPNGTPRNLRGSNSFSVDHTTACANYLNQRSYYLADVSAGPDQINVGQVLYEDSGLSIPVNGSSVYIAVNRDGTGVTVGIRVDIDGTILEVLNC